MIELGRYVERIKRDSWRLPDQEIIDIYHRMNLRDATKIINKGDAGITLNHSEKKLAELLSFLNIFGESTFFGQLIVVLKRYKDAPCST